MNWQAFVLEHGFGARATDLAHVVGQPLEAIDALRSSRAGARTGHGTPVLGFADLFSRFHGRAPSDADWPMPRRSRAGAYEWLPPEVALLATLVGTMGVPEMAAILSERLRQLTGDPNAHRSRHAVQSRIAVIGLQTSDVVGGLTTREAAQEIGSYAIVHQAIRAGQIKARRVGRQWVIPYDAWSAWKQGRVFPPKGFVPLASLREPLGIRSDSKLPEFAAAGHIPTAIRCTPCGADRAATTRFGTWYVDAKVARKLVADRRAGRPMPWHGQPNAHNLQVTWRLYAERRHPESCETCRQIWGQAGAPRSYDDYVTRYPPLAHGAKRHLTMPWSPGVSLKDLAAETGRSLSHIHRAIETGQLQATQQGRARYVSRSDATRWKERGCPTGDRSTSWISFATAGKQHDFSPAELRELIAAGKLPTKVIDNGPCRGETFVGRHACAVLREQLGYSEAQAARKAGVSVARLRSLLEGADWRGSDRIPLATVQAVIKRLESREGYTVAEAAKVLRTTEDWVEERIKDGTVRVSRAKWDRRRRYLSQPMLERLRQAKRAPSRAREKLSSDWFLLTAAAVLAGVSTTTMIRWGEAGEVETRLGSRGTCYHQQSIKARARAYWASSRYKRPALPAWLQAERAAARPSPARPARQSLGAAARA